MISVYEHQYEKGNKDNKQQRVIAYSDFDTYEKDLLSDKVNPTYPSLPKGATILNHHRNGNALTLEFHHPTLNCTVVHTALLIK